MKALLSSVLSTVVLMTTQIQMTSASDSSMTSADAKQELPVVLQYVAEEDDPETSELLHSTVQMLQKLQDLGVEDRLVLFTPGTAESQRVMLSRHATTMVPVSKLDIETSDNHTISATKLQSLGLTLFTRVAYMDSNPSLLDGMTDLQCLESSCDIPVCSNGQVFDDTNSGVMVLQPNALMLDTLKGMNDFGDVRLPEQALFHQLLDSPNTTIWSMLPEDCFGEADNSINASPTLQYDEAARIKVDGDDNNNASVDPPVTLSNDAVSVERKHVSESSSPSLMTVAIVASIGLTVILGLGVIFLSRRRRRRPADGGHFLLVDYDDDVSRMEPGARIQYKVPTTDDEEVPSSQVD